MTTKKHNGQTQRRIPRQVRHVVRHLHIKLTHPGKTDFYYHCRGHRRKPAIDLPKREFGYALWPDKGITFGEACAIGEYADKMRKAETKIILGGDFQLTAYWKTPNKDYAT